MMPARSALLLACVLALVPAARAQRAPEGQPAPQRMVAASPLATPQGVAPLGADLVVGSLMARQLLRIDAAGAVQVLLDAPEGLVDQLTADDRGRIAFTTLPAGELRVRATDGKVLAPLPGRGGLGATAFGTDGTLYAADAWTAPAPRGGTRVFRLPADRLDAPARGTTAPAWLEGLPQIASLHAARDGGLLATAPRRGEILHVHGGNRAVTVRAAGFALPVGAAETPDGRLMVLDAGRAELVTVEADGARRTLRVPAGTASLGLDSEGRAVVTDPEGNALLRLLDGRLVPVLEGGLQAASGLAWLADGGLLLADGFRLRRVDARGGLQSVVLPADAMASVLAAAPSREGAWIGSWVAGEVQRIGLPQGTVQVRVKDLNQPHGLLEAADGSLFVAEGGTGRILRVSADGRERQVVAEGLAGPVGLALDGTGLYVAEATGGRISRVDPLTGHVATVAENLERPTGLAWNLTRRLLVMESGRGRLLELQPGTGQTRVLVDGLAPLAAPPANSVSWTSGGLATARDGGIWFTTPHDRGLWRLPPR